MLVGRIPRIGGSQGLLRCLSTIRQKGNQNSESSKKRERSGRLPYDSEGGLKKIASAVLGNGSERGSCRVAAEKEHDKQRGGDLFRLGQQFGVWNEEESSLSRELLAGEEPSEFTEVG